MKRPDHPTTTVDHRFTDGSAVGGVPSTTLPAYVFNQLYDEVTAVIEGYGLTLDGTQSNQLYQAIQDAIAAAVAAINVDLSALAPKNSPILTGTPTAPTATAATNDGQIATTAFVQTLITNLVGGAPGALDTLKELADALSDDANFATTVANQLAGLQTLVNARPALSQWTSSDGSTGWRKGPDGYIEQWGRFINASDFTEGAGPSIVFPIAFSNFVGTIVFGAYNPGGANSDSFDDYIQVNGDPSLNGFSTYVQLPGAGRDFLRGFHWRANGK